MCPEHGRLCAYRGTEHDRCPWCHCLWSHVLASGSHSCESPGVWGGGKRYAWRVDKAAAMRHEAQMQAGGGSDRAGVDPTPTEGVYSPW